MPKRSSTDPNETAFRMVEALSGSPARKKRKNPAAVALGRLGGKKGGKARAAKLSPAQRTAIAKKAAATRWQVHSKDDEHAR